MERLDISIIVPVYNNSKLLSDLIETIANQSFKGTVECLFYDDGSTDDSLAVLQKESIKLLDLGMTVKIIHDGQNKKQGTRRNEGVRLAQGKYIIFLDSDDFIHSDTLKTCFETAELDKDTDMVHFNYAYYSPEKIKKLRYSPAIPNFLYNKGQTLVGADCETLLSLDPFFTVNRFYKREFLLSQKIEYGEGYFYEDIEFFVKSITKANKIKLLPNVFYYIRIHQKSTTKVSFDSYVHIESFLRTVKETMADFSPRAKYSSYNVTKYLLNRGLLFTKARMPQNKKRRLDYLGQLLELLPPLGEQLTIPVNYASPLYYACFKMGYYAKKDIKSLIKIYDLYRFKPKKLKRIMDLDRLEPTSLADRIDKKINKPERLLNLAHYGLASKEATEEKEIEVKFKPLSPTPTILMLGFDYKYIGNSKYLFKFLRDEYSSNVLKFATVDPAVPADYRINPRSEAFTKFLKESHVIIAESWFASTFEIQENQKVIQLWQGTPFKKLLYDSLETEIIRFNPTHKNRKKWEINHWDVLISDSPIATEKFKTAFSIEADKIVETGYPRVNWLLENRNNEKLKNKLRTELNIAEGQKVVLYLPTWREYNYKQGRKNNLYQLNSQRFNEHLPADFEYVIVEKKHHLSSSPKNSRDHVIELPSGVDIQPYLLIADIVISDYSAVIFDCLYLEIPFYLLFKDYDLYKNVRGVYEEMLIKFKDKIAYSEKELAEIIVNYATFYQDLDYSDYISANIAQSNQLILDVIRN